MRSNDVFDDRRSWVRIPIPSFSPWDNWDNWHQMYGTDDQKRNTKTRSKRKKQIKVKFLIWNRSPGTGATTRACWCRGLRWAVLSSTTASTSSAAQTGGTRSCRASSGTTSKRTGKTISFSLTHYLSLSLSLSLSPL